MRWLNSVRSWLRDPIELGGQASDATVAASERATRFQVRDRSGRKDTVRPESMSHSSQQALSGYGNNPYDTYTWELHSDPNCERSLKRATDVSRKTETGDPNNPYDTGTFKGGWQ